MVSIISDLEKAYDNTWKYRVMKDRFRRNGPQGTYTLFLFKTLSERKLRFRIGTSLSDF